MYYTLIYNHQNRDVDLQPSQGDDPKKMKPTLVVHPTAYDGSVELACIGLGLLSVSCSLNQVYTKTASEIVKGNLLQACSSQNQIIILQNWGFIPEQHDF